MALGFRLVEKTASRKEGYHLTEAGKELKAKFDRWVREVQGDAIERAKPIFSSVTIGVEDEGSGSASRE